MQYAEIVQAEKNAIRTFLAGRTITSKLGDASACCSIASINMATRQMLCDDAPPEMPDTIYQWLVPVQDAMPDRLRNAADWRALLPEAAYVLKDKPGGQAEARRFEVLKNWVWDAAMPLVRPAAQVAIFRGRPFSEQWDTLCRAVREAPATWNLLPPFDSEIGVVTGDDFCARGGKDLFWILRAAAERAGNRVEFGATDGACQARSLVGVVLDCVRWYVDYHTTDTASCPLQYANATDLAWVKLNPAAVLRRMIEV